MSAPRPPAQPAQPGTAARRPWLPNLLREMADAHGLATALGFAQRFGGQYLHLPVEARPNHPVAQHSGMGVLAWLIEQHDRNARIIVPKAAWAARQQRLEVVRSMTARGASANEIAVELALHVRQVERLRERIATDERLRQGSLPFDAP